MISGDEIQLTPGAIDRYLTVAAATGSGLVYSDFRDEAGDALADHPLIDYQMGSIRDSFDFGAMVVISRNAVKEALRLHGGIGSELKWGALYDLRLKMSTIGLPARIPEPLYVRIPSDRRASGDRQFDYVDPRNRDYQIEMEQIATAHLMRCGAYLPPQFSAPPDAPGSFPVRASVVIPVRNRERTIGDAVASALSQEAAFDFNVIVVDNHSTDGTTAMLAGLAKDDARVVHLIPDRRDLGIGGCWNEAVFSEHCGEVAIQLDSDDLYADRQTLTRIIDMFDQGSYGMVIGSYTIVSFDLAQIPPGLIDHSEWTRENGRNNALRINGLGAPRAFSVPLLRQIGLPNVSYGEDYAVALRISRDYEIGRIFDSLYLARRWEGNSDAALPIATANRYDSYKDFLRTTEMLARMGRNRQ